MNITTPLKKIENFFKKKSPSQFQRDPYSDWTKILFVFTVLILIVVGIDGYIFYKINLGELFVVPLPSSTHVEIFNQTLLKQDIDFYTRQEKNFNDAKTSSPSVIDPSL